MKVLIADAINEKGIENLKEVAEVVVDTSITPEELANTIHEYDGIVVRSRTKLTADIIKKADNMKIIARAGVGVDNIDLDAATEKGIMVVNSQNPHQLLLQNILWDYYLQWLVNYPLLINLLKMENGKRKNSWELNLEIKLSV